MLHAISPDSLRHLRRALRRRRRTLALLAAAGVLVAVLPAVAPADARTAPVVIAARALSAGRILGPSDLTVQEVPLGLVPDAALSTPEDGTGRRLAAPVAAGAMVPRDQLRAPDDRVATPGLDVLAVPADPALMRHLTPGSEVDVIVSTPDPAQTRTIRAIVADQEEPAGHAGDSTIVSGGSGVESAVILIAVDPSETAAIAFATREGWLVLAGVG